MSTDPRIEKMQARWAEVQIEYNAVREARIDLIRELYKEGLSVAQIQNEFNTTPDFLHRNLPEAFLVSFKDEFVINPKNNVVSVKQVPVYSPKPRGHKEPEYSEPEFGGGLFG